ncbi:MAG: aspartate/tyrosine/aromatic aminotransferase [Candidatus Scalindua sp. AMX11]|nr:MAG: aspartate/tyrosine/aromatic aminotransferase [Candidatus Scalindua sp.]NOG85024.1 aspartate/tyrosine/aromatic aminotransferase [Planctomycetota bacterium]RZV93139.1 MAG: aspartate/tyrosine/aromatic aminotransferase [Candidatus Scalindua sp. SCAELEC01]TDE66700.1 MAG: aspartate/tyrosine/aromatic aminotransferase [Candidatus Scalindua sp. AMX11]GJQ58008.1 MAG: aminotransferase [Candidatus Scalindua sp.]
MFEQLEMATADPILGLTEAFKADENPEKINLGVGVYKDEAGATPVMTSVKKAEAKILEQETTKNYLPMQGSSEYAVAVQELLFGAGSETISSKRAATAQTPGGTGALRMAGELIKQVNPKARLWVSDPTWANHNGIFGSAGIELSTYPYYNTNSKCLDFDAMVAGIKEIPAGDVILLHGCCHNPTGLDPNEEQWHHLATLITQRKIFPLFDFAYQGLATGIDEDATGLRLFAQNVPEMLIANSYSKNFGLYSERVGGLTIVCGSQQEAQTAFSHLKLTIRRCYSNPPSHGGAIVATIMADKTLRAEWETEVSQIRLRIKEMRELFVKTLKTKGVRDDFSFIARQNGMFSFSGLTKYQVEKLKQDYSIYIVDSGRINVAGMTHGNMDQLCEAIASVL